MSEIFKISNKSNEELIIEQSARIMILEYNYYSLRVQQYEFFIIQKPEDDEFILKSLRKQISQINLIKAALKNKFIEKFGLKLWDDIRGEYENAII
jgi:hypothetical protein